MEIVCIKDQHLEDYGLVVDAAKYFSGVKLTVQDICLSIENGTCTNACKCCLSRPL